MTEPTARSPRPRTPPRGAWSAAATTAGSSGVCGGVARVRRHRRQPGPADRRARHDLRLRLAARRLRRRLDPDARGPERSVRPATRRVDVRPAPATLERQPPGVRGDQLVDGVRAPAAGRVGPHRRRVVDQLVRLVPQLLDAVGGGEQRVVAAHRVVDQPLVGLQHRPWSCRSRGWRTASTASPASSPGRGACRRTTATSATGRPGRRSGGPVRRRRRPSPAGTSSAAAP